MSEQPEPMVCATCGRTSEVSGGPDAQAAARLTWVRGVENDRVVWTCDRCSRVHLRSIEGKLDSDWW